jgi:hypothetical protein
MQKRKVKEKPLYYVFKDLDKKGGRKDVLQRKIKSLALDHFKKNAKLLSKVFITNEDQDRALKFVVILKNDDYSGVNKIYRFLGDYGCTELRYKYPVDFRLLPQAFESSCKNKELVFED